MDLASTEIRVSHNRNFGRESADESEGHSLPWDRRGTWGAKCERGGRGA